MNSEPKCFKSSEISSEIPYLSKLKEPEMSHVSVIQTCHIELRLFSAVAGETIGFVTSVEAPAPVILDIHRGLCGQQQLGVLCEAVRCCTVQRSLTSAAAVGGAPGGSQRRPPRSRAVAGHDVHGRALRQEKGDDRRAIVVLCCPVQRGDAAVEELVEASPVAAQVAPHRRQVALVRRIGDVSISGHGDIPQKSVLKSSFQILIRINLLQCTSLLLPDMILNEFENLT